MKVIKLLNPLNCISLLVNQLFSEELSIFKKPVLNGYFENDMAVSHV